VPGWDVASFIDAVGNDVNRFKVGDAVQAQQASQAGHTRGKAVLVL